MDDVKIVKTIVATHIRIGNVPYRYGKYEDGWYIGLNNDMWAKPHDKTSTVITHSWQYVNTEGLLHERRDKVEPVQYRGMSVEEMLYRFLLDKDDQWRKACAVEDASLVSLNKTLNERFNLTDQQWQEAGIRHYNEVETTIDLNGVSLTLYASRSSNLASFGMDIEVSSDLPVLEVMNICIPVIGKDIIDSIECLETSCASIPQFPNRRFSTFTMRLRGKMLVRFPDLLKGCKIISKEINND